METTSRRPRIHRSSHLPSALDAMSTPMVRMPDGRLMVSIFFNLFAPTSSRADVDASRARTMTATGTARSSRAADALTRPRWGRRARDEDEGSRGVGGNCFFVCGSVFVSSVVHRFDARLTMGATGARDGDARREARRASRVGANRVVSRRVRSVACARSNRKLCSFVRARIRRRDAGSACPTSTRVARWRTRCARRWGREDWINSCETNAGTPPSRTTVRPL